MSSDLDEGASTLDVVESKPGNNSIPVFVDGTLKDFKISVAGGGPSIVVYNPNNTISNKAVIVLDLNNV